MAGPDDTLDGNARLRLARHAMDTAFEGIYWTDEHGRFVDVNRAACASLGYSREELLGMAVHDISPGFPSEDWPAHWRELKEKGSLTLDSTQRSRSGRVISVEVITSHIDFDGKEFSCAFVRDVTAKKEIERNLREREERLRVIFRISQAGIILVDPNGVITFANDRMAEMFGCTMKDLLGTPYPDHLHPSEKRSGDDRMRKLIAGEIDHVYTERHYVRRDGGDFWGYLSGRRHQDADGRLISLVGVIADITDRKQAEQALRASEGRYRALVDLAVDAILIGDPEGRIIGANESAVALTGYTRGELDGTNISILFSEAERARVPLRYDLLLEGKIVRNERFLTRKDGTTVPIEMNTKRMPDGSYQTFIRDCTERFQLQAEQVKAQKLESLGVLAGGIAHDFNNILTGILGNISFAQRLIGRDHAASLRLEECQQAAMRAGELTRQLLTFARGGSPSAGPSTRRR